ncbi:MAG: hypothetical protein OXF98_09765 [Rhodospirillaceae bacterium]|nr:hypothetical protein [Rhodospirillaceae bacterium]
MNDATETSRGVSPAADDYPQYSATLRVEGGDIYVGDLSVKETYNGGWVARLSFRVTDNGRPVDSVLTAMGTAISHGIFVGMKAAVYLGAYASADDTEGAQVRCFPGYVAAVEPFRSYDRRVRRNRTYLQVIVQDAVNHLKGQNVWGAFRAHCAAEIVGGVLALAGGTDGRATLNPAVPGHSPITVHNGLREELDFIPYAIASGQTMQAWMSEFFGRLGIRMELMADVDNCDLHIMLHDKAPMDPSLRMGIDSAEADGQVEVLGIGSYRGASARAGLLDDPTKGAFRRLAYGPVGTVVAGEHISLEEAQLRAGFETRGRGAELLMARVRSRQPTIRPGRTILLDEPLIHAIPWTGYWQASSVTHTLSGVHYENVIDLMRGDIPWHPARPVRRPAVIVPARVDAGPKYSDGEEVPRDRLGRIPVGFPFSPMPYEASVTQGFDVTGDQRVTKDDFSYILQNPDGGDPAAAVYWDRMGADDMKDALQKAAGEDSWLSGDAKEEAVELADTEARETDLEKLYDGEYDDPYPGRTDDDLTDDELDQRRERETQRARTYRYMAWKRALTYEESGGDYDHDGYTTVIDGRMSDKLKAEFANPQKLEQLEQEARERASEEGYTPAAEGKGDIVDEYIRLFGEGAEDSDIYRVAALQKDAADEQWPPRLPLPVMQPMAGGQHGFVSGHRQGDACRVAVHGVMRAEIVGFQYRSDRDLDRASMAGAVAGIVVEHNRAASWSGMVFRKTKQ